VFFTKTPVPDVEAFTCEVWFARTTLRVLEYCKKLAALKKYSKLFTSGLPKVSTNSCSLDILTISSKGPFVNDQQLHYRCETAGMILVNLFPVREHLVILEMP